MYVLISKHNSFSASRPGELRNTPSVTIMRLARSHDPLVLDEILSRDGPLQPLEFVCRLYTERRDDGDQTPVFLPGESEKLCVIGMPFYVEHCYPPGVAVPTTPEELDESRYHFSMPGRYSRPTGVIVSQYTDIVPGELFVKVHIETRGMNPVELDTIRRQLGTTLKEVSIAYAHDHDPEKLMRHPACFGPVVRRADGRYARPFEASLTKEGDISGCEVMLSKSSRKSAQNCSSSDGDGQERQQCDDEYYTTSEKDFETQKHGMETVAPTSGDSSAGSSSSAQQASASVEQSTTISSPSASSSPSSSSTGQVAESKPATPAPTSAPATTTSAATTSTTSSGGETSNKTQSAKPVQSQPTPPQHRAPPPTPSSSKTSDEGYHRRVARQPSPERERIREEPRQHQRRSPSPPASPRTRRSPSPAASRSAEPESKRRREDAARGGDETARLREELELIKEKLKLHEVDRMHGAKAEQLSKVAGIPRERALQILAGPHAEDVHALIDAYDSREAKREADAKRASEEAAARRASEEAAARRATEEETAKKKKMAEEEEAAKKQQQQQPAEDKKKTAEPQTKTTATKPQQTAEEKKRLADANLEMLRKAAGTSMSMKRGRSEDNGDDEQFEGGKTERMRERKLANTTGGDSTSQREMPPDVNPKMHQFAKHLTEVGIGNERLARSLYMRPEVLEQVRRLKS